MPFEKVTVTEEVQKDGVTQAIERETLKWTDPEPEVTGGTLAYGLTHPGFVPASERVYRWDESLGMSVSEPRRAVEPEPEESTADPEEATEETVTEPAEEEPLPEYKPSRTRSK